jgi:hypothetical protein
MLSLSDHWSGSPDRSTTPDPPGPRNCGQLPPGLRASTVMSALATISRIVQRVVLER